MEELELETLRLVHWHSQDHLHDDLGDVPRAGFEETLNAGNREAQELQKNTTLEFQ
jgi:hypothetical protein